MKDEIKVAKFRCSAVDASNASAAHALPMRFGYVGNHWKEIGVIAISSLLALIWIVPKIRAAGPNQKMAVAFVTSAPKGDHRPPDALFFGGEQEVRRVTKEVLERVRSLGIIGNFRVASMSVQGDGPKSRTIIVIKHPLSKEAHFPVPDATEVVYVQEANGWTKYPPDAHTLNREIRIDPAVDPAKEFGIFFIPIASGPHSYYANPIPR